MAFKIAAAMAFKDGVKKATPIILEPIMKVEIESPNEGDYVGNIMSSISQRRGLPLGNESLGSSIIIKAECPLAEMFGYVTDLRSATQGRASFSMEFDHYAEVPRNVAEKIIGERAKKD